MMLRVLSVASEAVPLVKTGGLADVAGALPAALAPHGIEMTTLLPGYPAVMKAVKRGRVLHSYDQLLGQKARLVAGKLGAQPLIVLDAPGLFARDGGLYGDANGHDWPDNWRRFAALGRAAADLAGGLVPARAFDLLHAHDWQAGLAPAYLRFAPLPGSRAVPTVMTIHNMAFQGYFSRETFKELGLPKAAWSLTGVEYHGGVGFLKAGMEAASVITTVSPTYAQEIRSPEYGMGLEGLIVSRGDRVKGIVNGIDPAEWNPATDAHIPAPYSTATIARRKANKRALEAEFGLEPGDGPLFIVVSRLTWQKGMDVLVEVLDHLVGLGGRLALLGSGDAGIIAGLAAGAARHPGRIGLKFGYDEALSHRLQAGGDAILVPSRFEPCGLTQLYGLAYGCVPVVARTGGLADTVIDANLAALSAGVATGIQFSGVTYPALADAITRAVALWHQPEQWGSLQRAGMKQDFSWATSGRRYAALYRELTGTP
ncbi:glycogen synthase GlgA [Sandarakinorhabdus oryzae]|uniref:glycogen synthase GlgA n=1 Tax=Sandarakinorhabdus oryzae TaxID=2675220 RepID=UPI0012E1C4D9|nr:glycogen synthase GlgA [Sandarakinorhabdus oryzae]